MNFITDYKFIEAINLIKTKKSITIIGLMNELSIETNYASMIIDDLYELGLISDYNSDSQDRKVLYPSR